MKTLFFTLLISFLLLTTSCWQPQPPKPQPEVLPPLTFEGKNTFGCLVNGKVWLPHTSGAQIAFDPQYYRGDFSLSATRRYGDSLFQTILWASPPIFAKGIYYFGDAPHGGPPGAGLNDYIK